MRLLVLTALLLVVFGAYLLLDATRELADGVGELATAHALAPRLLTGGDVPVTDGVAIFTLRCESETACSGTLTIALSEPTKFGTAAYTIGAGETRQVGVPLPAAPHGRDGTVRWRETSGATGATDFTLAR
jgi:hypothetical protein